MVASSRYGHAVADDFVVGPADAAAAEHEPRHDEHPPRLADPAGAELSGLYDVLDLILDKGIVIDAFVRVSLVGIELLTVDLRVVIASVDTYLRYAEGVERLQFEDRSQPKSLPDMVEGHEEAGTGERRKSVGGTSPARAMTRTKVGANIIRRAAAWSALSRGVRNVVGRLVGEDDDDEEQGHERNRTAGNTPRRRSAPARRQPAPDARPGR